MYRHVDNTVTERVIGWIAILVLLSFCAYVGFDMGSEYHGRSPATKEGDTE